MSLRNQSPIIYNYIIRTLYNKLLNKKCNNKCSYINKYGIKCNKQCLNKCVFIIREYFCEYHIINYINDIIKLNSFISDLSSMTHFIDNYLLNTYTLSQLQIEKIKYNSSMKKIYILMNQYIDYVQMTQPVLNILHDFIFHYLQIGIYNTDIFKININIIKKYQYGYIVNSNKKYRKECMDTLLDLTENPNNTIGKVFLNSKIADYNIFKIIELYI